MSPVDDTSDGEGDMQYDISGVEVMDRQELGGLTAIAKRNFCSGERVFREKALVIASATTNASRLKAYAALPPAQRLQLRSGFWRESPSVNCAATAACRPGSSTGDSAMEVWSSLRAEGFTSENDDISLEEVEEVIRVWNLNAYDRVLAPIACKVAHSCSPNISVNVDVDAGVVEATACRRIVTGDVLGSWYFQDTGLWWMGSDVRRAIFETERGFLCNCERCQARDPCRAIPCERCGCEASPSPRSSSTMTWNCSSCEWISGAGPPAARLASEAELVPLVLLELRPPRGAAGAARSSPEDLVTLAANVRERLGPNHWANAAVLLVLFHRVREPPGACDYPGRSCIAAGVRFLGWLVQRQLPRPPASVIRTPVAMALECAEWLIKDVPGCDVEGRCLAARILCDFLLPLMDASGSTVAAVAKTGEKVARLRKWLANLHISCGNCGETLGVPAADGLTVGTSAACGRCRQVRYCSRECQLADWKRGHKAGCLQHADSLCSDAAWKMLAAASR